MHEIYLEMLPETPSFSGGGVAHSKILSACFLFSWIFLLSGVVYLSISDLFGGRTGGRGKRGRSGIGERGQHRVHRTRREVTCSRREQGGGGETRDDAPLSPAGNHHLCLVQLINNSVVHPHRHTLPLSCERKKDTR